MSDCVEVEGERRVEGREGGGGHDWLCCKDIFLRYNTGR